MDDGEEEGHSQTVTIELDLPSGSDQKNWDVSDQPQQWKHGLISSRSSSNNNNNSIDERQNAKIVFDDADFLTICSPPSSSDLLRPWRRLRQNANANQCEDNHKNGLTNADGIVRVRHLRADMALQLEQRLNPPGCGSMRNWEFLAAHFGLDINQIVQMRRRTKNPMGALMRLFGDEPLLRLLELIGEAERIDVLISVSQFAEKPMAANECHRNRSAADVNSSMDSALISATTDASSPIRNDQNGHHFPSTSSTELVRSLANDQNAFGDDCVPKTQQQQQQQQRFILILHHENEGNRDLRKFHKLLIKNLNVYGKEEGIKIVDVDQCMCDQDLIGSVSRHFDRADQVVMELSPDYAELIDTSDQQADQPRTDQRVRMKLYLHQMTYNEVLFNGNQNRRFRVVLMQGCRPEHVPRGWPGNTLHYRFPQDFEALCQRLFDQKLQQQQQKMMMTN